MYVHKQRLLANFNQIGVNCTSQWPEKSLPAEMQNYSPAAQLHNQSPSFSVFVLFSPKEDKDRMLFMSIGHQMRLELVAGSFAGGDRKLEQQKRCRKLAKVACEDRGSTALR